MPKVAKPKSKRVPVRLRHKIEKASSAKQRKQRKEAKKNPQWRSRLKKDPGIPNLFPYKAKLLAEIEESKRMKEEEVMRKREIAKAQREGRVVEEVGRMGNLVGGEGEDEEELQQLEEDDDEEMVDNSANPMAALLSSAQARAQAHEAEPEDDDAEDDEDAWNGIEVDDTKSAPRQVTRKILSKQALADPIKAVSALTQRMQNTPDGLQQLLSYYQLPPLVTAGSNFTSRFLVEVARKRGRLGRGGIPNMHSAALIVLGDLNEERLQLPSEETIKPATVPVAAGARGEVKVVRELAPAFRIEGLFGDDGKVVGAEPMFVEA